MQENDTPNPIGETVTPKLENDAQTPASGAGVDSQELAARLAEAEKKAQQAEMRARQLENQRQEEERKKQEEEGKFRELYEQERARAAELEQQRQMDEMMAGYDPKIQEVAKKLFSAGDLPSQMAALQEAIKQTAPAAKVEEEEIPQPKVEPLNPNLRGSEPSILTGAKTLAEMEEALDKRLKGAGL